MATKVCKSCKQEKDETEFTRRVRGDLKVDCKPCVALQNRERRKNPEVRRQQFLRRMWNIYGLTPEAWDELVISHGGRCGICGRNPEMLHVDHCHELGHVRGLLCYPCNSMIGLAQDDVTRLERAVTYLKENA